MRKNQYGFSVIETMIILLLLAGLGFVGWRVLHRDTTGQTAANGNSLKSRKYNVYLDGATDDGLINYYKLGIRIDLESSNANIVDPGSSLGPNPCPEILEDYALSKSYEGDTLRVKVVGYKRVENPKGILESDSHCKQLDANGIKSFDLDKAWLSQGGKKTLAIEGLDGVQFSLGVASYKIELSNGSDTVSSLPYFPDKVAVLTAWGDSCPANSKELVTTHAKSLNLVLADEKYPGLEGVYRRPKREVNVILDELKSTDSNKYAKNLGGDCTIITSYPNLKDLRQTGLTYQ